MAKNSKGAQIRSRIINILAIDSKEKLSASALAKEFDVSRAYIYTLLSKMVRNGVLEKTGHTYDLKSSVDVVHQFPLRGLNEDIVYGSILKQYLRDIPERAKAAFEYIFNEMLNNAIDHSEGTTAVIRFCLNAAEIRCAISDDGVGIFNKIQTALKLKYPRFAIFELYKGKFTTDKKNHTGEGIFFSSKIASSFCIFSDELVFSADPDGDEPMMADFHRNIHGTTVSFSVRLNTEKRTQDIFDQYIDSSDENGFSKTFVPVRLLDYKESSSFVSRSQARRLMARFDRFKTIILDFSGVDEIGQGFADEVFRVFANSHPDSVVIPENMSTAIQKMIKHVYASMNES